MRKFIFLLAAAAAVSFVSCEFLDSENDAGEEIKYEYLYDCMWSLSESSPYKDEMPIYASDPDYPIFFTPDNKMVWMHFDGTDYTYSTHYSYSVDKTRGYMYLVPDNGGKNIMIHIPTLNKHHLTIYFGGDEHNYACYERQEFPENDVDGDSFPKGLLP